MDAPPYGVPITLDSLVTRVLAPNPSAYTGTGTQTHLVGTRELAVIDPGPDDDAHLTALLAAIAGRSVAAIVITHHHRDHSPLSRRLKERTGAPIVGAAPTFRSDGDPRADAAFDADYAPDRVLANGERLAGEGWTLEAITTPGHTSEHLSFTLSEAGAVFSGDHVMGWSTSVVSPPDGDMSAYMASLERLLARDDRVFYPGHGEEVERPQRWVRAQLGHRRQREGQVLRALAGRAMDITALTRAMYVGLDPRLLPAAERSALAHLIDLERRGLVEREGETWCPRT